MTPEEERRLKVAALSWQMRAERLERENRALRTRFPWLVVTLFAAAMGWTLAITMALTR